MRVNVVIKMNGDFLGQILPKAKMITLTDNAKVNIARSEVLIEKSIFYENVVVLYLTHIYFIQFLIQVAYIYKVWVAITSLL